MNPFPQPWGNYLLKEIIETKTPDEISWWPQTLAWKILLLLLVFFILRKIYLIRKRYLADSYRREALMWVKELVSSPTEAQIRQLPALLKKVALNAYERSDIAKKSGAEWEHWLDQQCSRSHFSDSCPNVLYQLSYAPIIDISSTEVQHLIKEISIWIRFHGKKHD